MPKLQKIDQVMFWSARLATAYLTVCVAWDALRVVRAIAESCSIMGHWHPLLTTTIVTQATIWTMLILLNCAFFFPRHIAARLFLYLMGAWFFLGGGPAAALSEPGLGWKLSAAAAIAGFAAMMWIAIRPVGRTFVNVAP